MSTARSEFEAAAAGGQWGTAFRMLNGLNMHEMLRTLAQLGKPVVADLWEKTDAHRPSYGAGMDRMEYAILVVKTGKLPPTAPGDLAATGQVGVARKFLAEASRPKVDATTRNTVLSYAACKYALSTLQMRASNWVTSRPEDSACVVRVRDEHEAKKKEKSGVSRVRDVAEAAVGGRCGNCGEFAATAFIFLYDRGARPLDLMELVDGNHMFVVIGRANKDPADWTGWGPAAVVCDPWGQGFRGGVPDFGTYPAKVFGPRMGTLALYSYVSSRLRVG